MRDGGGEGGGVEGPTMPGFNYLPFVRLRMMSQITRVFTSQDDAWFQLSALCEAEDDVTDHTCFYIHPRMMPGFNYLPFVRLRMMSQTTRVFTYIPG